MSSQAPARIRRAKASSDSFAGLIVGSFIIAALAEEWRATALKASHSDRSELPDFGGEDAFSFGRDSVHSTLDVDPVGFSLLNGASLPTLYGVADLALAAGVDGLHLDGTAAVDSDQDDAAGILAHHHAGWLITHA